MKRLSQHPVRDQPGTPDQLPVETAAVVVPKHAAGTCAVLVLLLLALPARAGTLWVSLPEGDGPCTLAPIAEALRGHLPLATTALGPHPVGGDDVSVRLIAGRSHWQLRVQAAGEPQLERELPPPGGDCLALAETAALMTERYLTDIRWATIEPVVSTLPPTPPAPPWRLVLELSGLAQLDLLGPAPGFGVSAGVTKGRWQLALAGQLDLPAATPVSGAIATAGSLQIWAGAIFLSVSRLQPLSFGALRLDLEGGAEIDRATVAGDARLFQVQPRVGALPFAGLALGYQLPLTRRLYLLPKVEVRAHLGTLGFTVDQTAPASKPFDGNLALAAGYTFF